MRMLRYYNGPPKYMYELKEDHLIRYIREDDEVKEYKMDELWIFHFLMNSLHLLKIQILSVRKNL